MDTNEHQTVPKFSSLQALRQKAEFEMNGKVVATAESLEAMTPAMVLRLLHELQVHQIELEMQNEELRKTQLELEEARARYFDLYDLAPISYCTLDEMGVILEANLATTDLLGEPRRVLVGQRISRYILKDYQDSYYLCRKHLLTSGERQSCELHMVKADSSAFWVNLTIASATTSTGKTVQRLVLTDITNAKVMALAMCESESRLRTLMNNIPSVHH